MNIYRHNNLFLDNKYTTWYYQIIENALNQKRKIYKKSHTNYVYYESHHILPRSMFTDYSNSTQHKWNIVLLTPKEHFIVHFLLTKMTFGKSLIMMQWAFNMMCTTRQGERFSNSIFYAKNKQNLKHSPETIAKCTGPNNGFYGKTHSNKVKQHLSKLRKGVPLTEEHKLKIKQNHARHNLGKTMPDKTKEKLRIIMKEIYSIPENHPCFGKQKSDTTKSKIGAKAKRRKWYNNGEIEVSADQCPSGFRPGRLPRTEEHNRNAGLSHRGFKWYTNGIFDKKFKGNDIPDGFVPGRCLKKLVLN